MSQSEKEEIVQALIKMQDKLMSCLQEVAAETFLYYSDAIKENSALKAEIERIAKLLEDAESDKRILSERLKLLEGKSKSKKKEAKK